MKASTLRPNKHKTPPGPIEKNCDPALARRIAQEQATARLLRKENRKKALEWLCDSFPAVFNLDAPIPLAIGIHTVILKLEIRKNCAQSNLILKKAINEYVTTTKYLESIIASNRRYDIDGNPQGVVTANQKVTAQEILQKYTRKNKENENSETAN